MWQQLLNRTQQGDAKALARLISLIENEVSGYEDLLQQLPPGNIPVIGITGPPGAGKSTLVDALIAVLTAQQKKIGVLCIDPSSPFNLGALLGDRIRMSNWYTHPNVFIRSLATRGSLGGLHPMIIEIADVMKCAGFDYIIIETVGVGQSEIEIAGLADTTIVVVVPEAGDDIQTMKAGVMEIADIFIVNKADRPGADIFAKNLRSIISTSPKNAAMHIPVLKTIASKKEGIDAVITLLQEQVYSNQKNEKHLWLLAERAYYLLQKKAMRGISKHNLKLSLQELSAETHSFNMYQFVANYA